MRLSGLALPALGSCLLLACGSVAAAGMLLPHRAVYDLSLEDATESSGIDSVEGRMVYQFAGSPCEGYTTRVRYVTRVETDDMSRLTDLRTTTYEGADGRSFRFDNTSLIDRSLDQEVRGWARTDAAGTNVTLKEPEAEALHLAPTQFPTAHLQELLRKAAAGEHFYETTLFDGADKADTVMTTSVVAGDARPMAADDPERKAMRGLASDPFWPVTIAYFDGKAEDGEETPDYGISFKLHESGITRDLTMRYGDFSLKGRLVDLALLKPDGDCHAK